MLSPEHISDINRLINPAELFKKIDFHPDDIQEDEYGILGYCPLHGDHIIKTLALDKQNKTFRCRYTLCPGFKGGNMVEFWAIYKDISPEKAAFELVKMFSLQIKLPQEKELIEKEISLARDALNNNDYATARQHVNKALEYDPKNVQANKLQAMLDYEENSATQFFSQLSKMKDLAQEKKETTQILELLSQISDYNEPSIKITHKKLEILQALDDQQAVIGELMSLASMYQASNFLDKALFLYNTIIEYEPTNMEAKDAIVQLLPRAENQQTAVDLFFKLYENHMNDQNHKAALQDLEEILALQPTNGMAYEELSNLYISLGNKKKACQMRLEYARILYEQNNITDALKYAADSLNLDPDSEEVYLFLAKLYMENNLSSAKANHYYLMAGKILIDKKKYLLALRYLEKLSPDSREGISSLKSLVKVYIHLKKEDYAVFYSLKLVDKYVVDKKINKAEAIFRNISSIYPKNRILKEKQDEFKKMYLSGL